MLPSSKTRMRPRSASNLASGNDGGASATGGNKTAAAGVATGNSELRHDHAGSALGSNAEHTSGTSGNLRSAAAAAKSRSPTANAGISKQPARKEPTQLVPAAAAAL